MLCRRCVSITRACMQSFKKLEQLVHGFDACSADKVIVGHAASAVADIMRVVRNLAAPVVHMQRWVMVRRVGDRGHDVHKSNGLVVILEMKILDDATVFIVPIGQYGEMRADVCGRERCMRMLRLGFALREGFEFGYVDFSAGWRSHD